MKTILAIEDEYAIREAIKSVLSYEGFDVISARNGLEGVELAKKYLPDLILCDIMMPGLDGYEVIAELQKFQATATIPFVFLTARVDKTDLRRGMELGADDYLMKPFRADELLAAVRTRLEKKETLIQNGERKLKTLRGNIIHALPHELRTPLTSILGFSNLLVENSEMLEPSQIKEMSKSIRNAARNLERLIQNFLTYAQIELTLEDEAKLTYLRNQYIENPVLTITEPCQQKAVEFGRGDDLTLDIEHVPIWIASSDLKKVIWELMDNAFKFSTAGTPIVVTAKLETGNEKPAPTEPKYVIEITNRGRGMTPDQIANIGAYMQFERAFYEQKGQGMGLIIAKRLIELHEGTLRIFSVPESETTVQIKLNPKLKDKSTC
ncbi:MAG: hybrid sensor histidine kinase/response regulator [Gemmatimonadetes bacterium]|nr:MAG: hybrid sensor histidine kinase/response regulator [Gemmatimonadota bacterium]